MRKIKLSLARSRSLSMKWWNISDLDKKSLSVSISEDLTRFISRLKKRMDVNTIAQSLRESISRFEGLDSDNKYTGLIKQSLDFINDFSKQPEKDKEIVLLTEEKHKGMGFDDLKKHITVVNETIDNANSIPPEKVLRFATVEELMEVKGIGEKTAVKIRGKNFKDLEDMKVSPKIISALKEKYTV